MMCMGRLVHHWDIWRELKRTVIVDENDIRLSKETGISIERCGRLTVKMERYCKRCGLLCFKTITCE